MADYLWVGLLGVLGVIVVLAIRLRRVFAQRPRYAAHWQTGNERPPQPDSLHMVVLGDSIMQGIGASSPEKGLAGLAVSYIAEQTGRSVRLTNLSRTGAKVAEVVANQLPLAPLEEADIVLVTVSANDAVRGVPLPEYRAHLEELLKQLPAEKTIVADVALVKAHPVYQPIMRELADSHGVCRAKLATTFADAGSPLKLVAGDFFHPNDRGYRMWFAAFLPEMRALLAKKGLT
ncbi:MAG TPA: GDSL-type esterase/lipase family protein [Mycobacteriales bacterium]|jgi:lysophospholipase L1-like esterase|nr:GDSL-type esterase/lipase family protein [Mycobacteriales bacterium]